MMIGRSIFKSIIIIMTSLFYTTNCKRYPIILLSGYMGNQMTVRTVDSHPPFGCLRNTFIRVPLWLDAIQASLFPECWQHKMELHYDSKLHKSFSNKGVDIQLKPFGSTDGVDFIAPIPQQNRISEYYASLIRSLELHAGYKRNEDLFGAPYDWRKGPHEQPEFFEQLRQLVERAYFQNDNTPVILLGHSMGGNYVYIFLRNQSAEWKKKFVRTSFFMAVPWGGNVKYLYSYLYNDDFAGNILPMFREIERSFPALAFLLPNRRVFGHDVLVQSPENNYTAYDLEKLLVKIGMPDVIPMWKDTRNLMDPFEHPGTDIVCVVGAGFNTIRRIIFTQDAMLDHKYRVALRRRKRATPRSELRSRRREALQARNRMKINELYASIFNRTAFLSNVRKEPNRKASDKKRKMKPRFGEFSSLEGAPSNNKDTEKLINLVGGKFDSALRTSMFDFLNIGRVATQGFPFIGNIRRTVRDNFFNSNRILNFWHLFQSVINPNLPKNAYDAKNGRYIFFSEGDSFVNIESGIKCLDWYSNSSNPKYEFHFDLINDNHLGMLRNKKSIEYFTNLIMAIA